MESCRPSCATGTIYVETFRGLPNCLRRSFCGLLLGLWVDLPAPQTTSDARYSACLILFSPDGQRTPSISHPRESSMRESTFNYICCPQGLGSPGAMGSETTDLRMVPVPSDCLFSAAHSADRSRQSRSRRVSPMSVCAHVYGDRNISRLHRACGRTPGEGDDGKTCEPPPPTAAADDRSVE